MATRAHRRRSGPSGLTLIEVLVSLLILGIALAGILPAAWNAIRAVSLQGKRRRLSTETRKALEDYVTKGRQLLLRDGAETALFVDYNTGRRVTVAALQKHCGIMGIRWNRVVERYRRGAANISPNGKPMPKPT